MCGIPWQSATSLLPLLRLFGGVTWWVSQFRVYRAPSQVGVWEKDGERSWLSCRGMSGIKKGRCSFRHCYRRQLSLCGWAPAAAPLSLSAAGQCHLDVQLLELDDGVAQLCWAEKEELKWSTEQLEIILLCLLRRKTHPVTTSYNLKAITPFKIKVHSTEFKCTTSCRWFQVLHELLARIKLRADEFGTS